jgi:hypothetical protein
MATRVAQTIYSGDVRFKKNWVEPLAGFHILKLRAAKIKNLFPAFQKNINKIIPVPDKTSGEGLQILINVLLLLFPAVLHNKPRMR